MGNYIRCRATINDALQNSGWKESLIFNTADYGDTLAGVTNAFKEYMTSRLQIAHKEVSVLSMDVQDLTAGSRPKGIQFNLSAGSQSLSANSEPAFVSVQVSLFADNGARRSIFLPGTPDAWVGGATVAGNAYSPSAQGNTALTVLSEWWLGSYIRNETNAANRTKIVSIIPVVGTAPQAIVTTAAGLPGGSVGNYLTLYRVRSITGYSVSGSFPIIAVSGNTYTISDYRSGLTCDTGWCYTPNLNTYQKVTSSVLNPVLVEKKLGGSYPRRKGRRSGGRRLVV